MTSASSCGVTHFAKSAFGMLARLAAVSMVDGSTALTVILPFHSAASASVRRCTPAFEAAYAPMPPPACRAPTAPTLPMRPAEAAGSCGILRGRIVDPGHPRGARRRDISHDLAQRTACSRHGNNSSVHHSLRVVATTYGIVLSHAPESWKPVFPPILAARIPAEGS